MRHPKFRVAWASSEDEARAILLRLQIAVTAFRGSGDYFHLAGSNDGFGWIVVGYAAKTRHAPYESIASAFQHGKRFAEGSLVS